MAKLTMIFGCLLVLVAVLAFVATGSSHPTSLIPGGVGLLFVLFGALANSPDVRKRMLWMHVAVTVALLLFLGTVPADLDVFRLAHGVALPHPVAMEEKAAMSLLCLLFVLACMRSFIAARGTRATAQGI